MIPGITCPVLARKPRCLEANGAPLRTGCVGFVGRFERVRRKITSAAAGNRQMVDILNAV